VRRSAPAAWYGWKMETTFFQDAGATVTNTRFITGGQTHALSGITSVSAYTREPNRVAPVIVGFIGLLLLIGGSVAGALPFLIVAVFWWILSKPSYSVVIRTAAGEAKALTDEDQGRVERVVAALNEAIVFRG
jgi:Family of unknown function (DUF6232)